jgi:hypothetical protein
MSFFLNLKVQPSSGLPNQKLFWSVNFGKDDLDREIFLLEYEITNQIEKVEIWLNKEKAKEKKLRFTFWDFFCVHNILYQFYFVLIFLINLFKSVR